MAGLCEGGIEPSGSLKANYILRHHMMKMGIRCDLVKRAPARRAENPGSNPGAGENFSPVCVLMERLGERNISDHYPGINEAVLKRVDEERVILKLIRKRNCLDHWLRRNCLLKDALEGMVNERRVRDRRRYQVIDKIKIHGSYEERKRKAENREDWRKLGLQ
ncbi:hypothetical protein ANN_23148 [Periplaneta americana]|uniref:Uncharacterized protein n=1 Tax=Periplaneta americana TaxID=6978 RepID=A0ABQ8SLJ7_PERAM|nr:hypothetical protein ANN_23148 [Periplaneta americana]